MPQPDSEDRKIFNTLTLFALLIRCPAGEAGEDGNCPFAEFRKIYDLEEKFLFAENLPDEKCREMLGIHEICLAGTSRNHRNIKRSSNPTGELALLPPRMSTIEWRM